MVLKNILNAPSSSSMGQKHQQQDQQQKKAHIQIKTHCETLDLFKVSKKTRRQMTHRVTHPERNQRNTI